MKKERILIVDGDEYVRKMLARSLEERYLVYTSPSFNEALGIFREIPFNVIITEIDTPEVRGIEVVRKFKEIRTDTTIIVVTSYDSIPLAIEAMKEGAYDYVTKPFNMEELELVVLHALERQRLIEEVRERELPSELAILDNVTGVYNRKYFEELLRQEVARATRYPQKFSLLLIEVDDFDKFKENYGERETEVLLRSIAKIILAKTRITDFPARYKDAIFSLITPHTDKKGASTVAARLLDLIAKEDFVLENGSIVKVTVSIGVSTFDDDATSAEQLIEKTEEALYQAKRLGKNRICLFGESSEENLI
ncbi:MAG: hypothetical protein B6D55_00905 [Candidatus Omnitrophica bacterium 4484_70.2]|nr:MAG: hypothetical protein B6D55_00905 [Candidatus Omnitrophica bacterium 4484_70.2]